MLWVILQDLVDQAQCPELGAGPVEPSSDRRAAPGVGADHGADADEVA